MPRSSAAVRLLCLPALALLAALGAAAAPAPAAGEPAEPRVVLAFLPEGGDDNPAPVLDRLEARESLAIGLVSATQGRSSPEQMVLDVSSGSRTSRAVYDPEEPPALELVQGGDGSGFVFGWNKALDRAQSAPAEIKPGLLADRIAGGAAYAGVAGRTHVEAAAAADREGDIGSVSLGDAASVAGRARALLERHLLVVVGLPTSDKGDAALDELLRARRPQELLVVVQTPPRVRVPMLLPIGIVGLGGNGRLTSSSTHLKGIVAGIDIPVTIWRHLAIAKPRSVRGQPIHVEGVRDASALRALEARLRVVSGRRTPVLAAMAFGWLALVLALGVAADRRGVRTGLRVGALAFMWVLPTLLVTGWLAPSRMVEVTIVVAGAFGLAVLTDRLVSWPRAPAVPAAASVVSYCVDLIFGSPLIIRSLLGVNPRSGSRFYGLGNELESTLTVLLLVGLGALLFGRGESRRAAAMIALTGLVFAVFVGAGRLGADVGGVITVGAGIAAAAIVMAPGRPSRRLIAVAVAVPFGALVALALLDLATGGDGHFTRTVLQADSAGSLWDVVKRRYTLAFNVLVRGAMPFLVVVGALAVAYALRHRERIYAPLRGSPSWHAALVGGLTASIVGALFNDSGPLLFAFGVFVLTCATAYVRGDPALVD